jgi:hypothetical protein
MMHVFCNECSVPHPTGIVVESAEDIDPNQSVADAYDGRELLQEIATFTNNSFRCPATGNFYRQKDNRQVFLVKTPT